MFEDRLPTVLIVDDDDAVLDWLRLSLALRGWVVTVAHSGEEALDVLDAETPDLVIVDHEMPGMSGIGVAAELRRREIVSCVLLFSAFIDAERTAMAERLDVQPISKVDQPALFRTVDRLQQDLLALAAPTG